MTGAATARARFLIVALMLAGTAIFLHSRGMDEALPPRQRLDTFPSRVGEWKGRDLTIAPEIAEVLGRGEFLSRFYRRTASEPYVDLFLAYFPSQRTGDTIHSPQNCLPGAGWSPVEFSRIQLPRPGGGNITVNQYVIAKGMDRQVVIYWYQAHGRIVASEYWAKFYLVADAIRMNRTDGALVRFVTPVDRQESNESSRNRAIEFAGRVLPFLDGYIPR